MRLLLLLCRVHLQLELRRHRQSRRCWLIGSWCSHHSNKRLLKHSRRLGLRSIPQHQRRDSRRTRSRFNSSRLPMNCFWPVTLRPLLRPRQRSPHHRCCVHSLSGRSRNEPRLCRMWITCISSRSDDRPRRIHAGRPRRIMLLRLHPCSLLSTSSSTSNSSLSTLCTWCRPPLRTSASRSATPPMTSAVVA